MSKLKRPLETIAAGKVMEYIQIEYAMNRRVPTYRQIQNALNIASISTVKTSVDRLVSEGYLKWTTILKPVRGLVISPDMLYFNKAADDPIRNE